MRPHARHRRSGAWPARRGVALIEALVGGMILAVGLGVLLSIASTAMAQQRLGEERIVAVSLIDELLNMVLVEGPANFSKRHDVRGKFAFPFEQYEFDVEIESQGEIEPYKVRATVRWFSGGYWRSATVDTLLSQPRGEVIDEPREPGEPISR